MKFLKYILIVFIYYLGHETGAQTYFRLNINGVSFSSYELFPTNLFLSNPMNDYLTYKTLASFNNNSSQTDTNNISPNGVIEIKTYTQYKKYQNASLYTKPNQLICYKANLYTQYYNNINFETETYRLYDRFDPTQNIFFESRYFTTNPNLILIR
jgi:hypothetical protein